MGSDVSAAFSVVQRLASACTRLFEPVNTALFPYLAKFHKDVSEGERGIDVYHNRFSKIIMLFAAVVVSVTAAMIFFRQRIQKIFFGSVFDKDLQIMYVLILLSIIFNSINPIFVSSFVVIRKPSVIKFITGTSMCVSLACTGGLIIFNSVTPYGVAMSVALASITSTLGCIVLSRRLNRLNLAS